MSLDTSPPPSSSTRERELSKIGDDADITGVVMMLMLFHHRSFNFGVRTGTRKGPKEICCASTTMAGEALKNTVVQKKILYSS